MKSCHSEDFISMVLNCKHVDCTYFDVPEFIYKAVHWDIPCRLHCVQYRHIVSAAKATKILQKTMKNVQALIIVISSALLLHECVGRPEYEDCNRKIRRQILESCSSEKGKRSAEYDAPSLPIQDEPLQNLPSSALLGSILGVPSQWAAADVAAANANRQVKRSPETIRQLMIDCCLANCSPDRFLGMC